MIYSNIFPNRLLYTTLIFVLTFFSCGQNQQQTMETKELTEVLTVPNFVGTKTCSSCHEKEYQDWRGSDHDLAMQIADSSTVLANFDTVVVFNNVKSEFFRQDGAYYVRTSDKNGQMQNFKIVWTFGIAPLQQYIAEFPNGSYQCLQTAWDTREQRWFDLQPNLNIEPGEWLHWTGNAMKWNTACADCHSTNLYKNFDPGSGSYHTSFSEINVGCESCHGPGSEHVSFYNAQKQGSPPNLYIGKNLKPADLVQKCARCHSRRTQLTPFFDYKGHYLDHYEPQLITTPIYEEDGQILDEDYVYGSFTQSKMYQMGITCSNCHNMHSLKLKAAGNTLCLQCHAPTYDSQQHHFHPVGTASSECINCHMTGRYYMGNDFRRDHSFRIPRPDQSVQYGTPNACNSCHIDKDASWASKAVEKWYGSKRKDHFSDHLLKGLNGENEELFYLLQHHEKYPEIVRASAISYLTSRIEPDEVAKISRYLSDYSPLVRNEAVKLIGSTQPPERVADLLWSNLSDTVRMVRINSARFLSRAGITKEQGAVFDSAKNEYLHMLQMNADFAQGQQGLAEEALANGDVQGAVSAYRKGLEIDNYDNIIRMNLALLRYQNGATAEAESLYLKVTEQEPNVSYSYYMLGLLYNEQNTPELAAKYLQLACEKAPYLEKAYYNYAIFLQQKEQFQSSIALVHKGLSRGGQNQPDLLYLQLLAEIKLEHRDEALSTAAQLIKITNNNPRYVEIYQRLQNENDP